MARRNRYNKSANSQNGSQKSHEISPALMFDEYEQKTAAKQLLGGSLWSNHVSRANRQNYSPAIVLITLLGAWPAAAPATNPREAFSMSASNEAMVVAGTLDFR